MTSTCIQTPLWVSGDELCHTYRIPALTVTAAGTVLAFCEGRRHSMHDAGQIDLLLRRSEDQGRTWEPTRLLVADPDMTCGNPCPIVDKRTGAIWLLFCKNHATAKQGLIMAGQADRTAWVTSSRDDGVTWSQPREISDQVKDPRWTWYATGPGHGIQLRGGRLIAPANHCNPHHYRMGVDPYTAHVIYSDDGGESWRIGGFVDDNTNEGMLVELGDGSLFYHCRYEGRDDYRRVVAFSRDGGLTFSPPRRDGNLFDPTCQASSLAITSPDAKDSDMVLFAHPDSGVANGRARMTVRLSTDGCRTWNASRVLHFGHSAYSDLAQTADGSILCLYEHGIDVGYQRMMLARFNLDWLRA